MEIKSIHFKERASERLKNEVLQGALARLKPGAVAARANVITELDDFEGTREAAKQIRQRALDNLDIYLEEFEKNATARGATVYWAETAQDVNRLVVEIAQRHAVQKVIKSKSMVSEETELNKTLEASGIKVVETDLGEYILQLADEPPSHIVMPVMHKSKDEISDLFVEHHQKPRLTDVPAMCREAREVLRPHFLTADMGISGANFLIAETGSGLIVTNEGNGRMTTTMPRVHVAITGIEKVVPNLEDVSTLLRLLPRSATGQSITNYVSCYTGPRGAQDPDGPEHMYFILVDAGRSQLLGTELSEALRCIRCGACMNHCPVYQNVGGHSYGWVYPGPIGSVLTPAYKGIENAIDLPNASTLCNQCGVVCPVMIPLPDLLRKLREIQFEQNLRPWKERMALKIWAKAAQHPKLYALGTQVAARLLNMFGSKDHMLHHVPGAEGWTAERDLPAPAGKTFRELYKEREQK